MAKKTILLTGATGLVGSHTAEALCRQGVRVRALVRPTSNTGRLEALGVELVHGALPDSDPLRRALDATDTVLHLAAVTSARSSAEYDRTNAEGTAALLRAALAATTPPRRFVYLSSMAAVGPSVNGRPVRPHDTPRPLTAYGRSKLAGEAHCLSVRDRIEIVVLRAPTVYGPRDRDVYHFFRLAARGVLPVPTGPARPLQLLHVEDLAAALVHAATVERAAGVFHVAEPRAYTWEQVARLVAQAVGVRARVVRVPASLIRAAGLATEWLGAVRGARTIFDREKASELLAPGWLCDTAATAEEFGFEPRIGLEEGLRGTAAWYRGEGWL